MPIEKSTVEEICNAFVLKGTGDAYWYGEELANFLSCKQPHFEILFTLRNIIYLLNSKHSFNKSSSAVTATELAALDVS